MATLELRNITYVYGKGAPYEIKALDDVSLTFEEGKIIGLIGHTGSGKSTLVQMLNGLIKPDSGKVLLDGKDIWEEPKKIRDVRFKVGLVMQYPEYQLFDETVWADIAFGPKNMGMSEDEIKKAVTDAAHFAGVREHHLGKSPFDLSGGQKRRAALAGVIAMGPKVLVLDEPAAGLDPGARRRILGRIKEYQKESHTTVIIVSHSMEDMAMYCDSVVVMNHGKVTMTGTPAEVFSRADELVAQGLDVPAITKVARALRKAGLDIGLDIYTVKFAVHRLLGGDGDEG
ncbi:MAG: energy-coupling factor transporter ATPase [Ruminococcaceae bacterium]|nr:energy-coupling factor transporter ATPase [Oscillospiraceae bacterium]